jgi:hypothetical protein
MNIARPMIVSIDFGIVPLPQKAENFIFELSFHVSEDMKFPDAEREERSHGQREGMILFFRTMPMKSKWKPRI